MILDDFLQIFTANTLESKFIDEVLIMDTVFDDVLKSVMKKEIGFIVQLERDSEAIF
jgi:hypothetical protein